MAATEHQHREADVVARTAANGELTLSFSGRLDSHTAGQLWARAIRLLERTGPGSARVDASGVQYCDGAGVALLLELRRRQEARGGSLSIEGLAEESRRLMAQFDPAELDVRLYVRDTHLGPVERVGRATAALLADLRSQVEFTGQVLLALGGVVARPRRVRWKDVFIVIEKVGANALPIVVLVGFLMGLIMSFQSAVILKQFGVEVLVAKFIGLAFIRELGPLVTAIVLAGRSGSSFAAELGTMELNDEISAIRTMGLEPVRLLVTARVIAAVTMMPFLTIFFDMAAIIGGAFVMLPLGIPLVTYARQVLDPVDMVDVVGGLFKAVVLGLLVAGIGCLRGLQTERSATGVGDAATSAVVSGIILIALASGAFAVVFYYLGV